MNDILQLESERSSSTSLISYYVKAGPNNSGPLLTKELKIGRAHV